MKRYIKLYEEFDPSKAKARLNDKASALRDKMIKRKERIKKAELANDPLLVNIHKARLDVDELDANRLKIQNRIVDMRARRNKEKTKSTTH